MSTESLKQDLDGQHEGPVGAIETGPTYWVQRGEKLVEFSRADHKPTGAEKPYSK